jgi:hypothetical protein
MIQPEERETTIVYDHYTGEVSIFTTQADIIAHFKKRLGKNNPDVTFLDRQDGSCTISTTEKVLRKPYYVSPVVKSIKSK